jgi:hypothetical protein
MKELDNEMDEVFEDDGNELDDWFSIFYIGWKQIRFFIWLKHKKSKYNKINGQKENKILITKRKIDPFWLFIQASRKVIQLNFLSVVLEHFILLNLSNLFD